jgi:hypothetical protein
LAPAGRALVLVDIAHRSESHGVERIVSFMTGNPDGFATIEDVADAHHMVASDRNDAFTDSVVEFLRNC